MRVCLWVKRNCGLVVACILVLLAAYLVLYFALSQVEKYEETRYDTQDSKDGVEVYTLFTEAVDNCKNKKESAHQAACYSAVQGFVESHIPPRDLIAQETVALATRGLLWVGAIQALVGFFTLGFVIWAVLQTNSIVAEAKKTTKAADDTLAATKEGNANQLSVAHNTLKETARATNYELKPYLSLNFERAHFGETSGNIYEHEMVVGFSLINDGLTPATHVYIEFQKEASGVFFKRRHNWDGHPIVFNSLKAPLIATLTSVPSKSATPFVFSNQMWTTDSEQWADEIAEYGAGFDDGRGEPEFTFWQIIFNGLEIRYKDLECENTNRHKLMKGTIHAEVAGNGAGVYDWEFCDDNKHDHYKQLAERREAKRMRGVL